MGQSLVKDITDNTWTPENPYNSKVSHPTQQCKQ